MTRRRTIDTPDSIADDLERIAAVIGYAGALGSIADRIRKCRPSLLCVMPEQPQETIIKENVA